MFDDPNREAVGLAPAGADSVEEPAPEPETHDDEEDE